MPLQLTSDHFGQATSQCANAPTAVNVSHSPNICETISACRRLPQRRGTRAGILGACEEYNFFLY